MTSVEPKNQFCLMKQPHDLHATGWQHGNVHQLLQESMADVRHKEGTAQFDGLTCKSCFNTKISLKRKTKSVLPRWRHQMKRISKVYCLRVTEHRSCLCPLQTSIWWLWLLRNKSLLRHISTGEYRSGYCHHCHQPFIRREIYPVIILSSNVKTILARNGN